MEVAAKWFCNDDGNIVIDARNATVSLSHIFRWYNGDFGTSAFDSKEVPTLQFIYKYLKDTTAAEVTKKEALKLMLDSLSYSVKWIPYDWTVNEKPQSEDNNNNMNNNNNDDNDNVDDNDDANDDDDSNNNNKEKKEVDDNDSK